ncbi:DUF6683 family protein [Nitrogeniibacter aestuarii]|uniref:DUF6683 family protein n=1 Tax=Nitrogeniibacter aestuarii TaxID=2815343 RepID=UPI001E590233|nr:DUF6683 family protein [Nitrogeniibacter aestuarii]
MHAHHRTPRHPFHALLLASFLITTTLATPTAQAFDFAPPPPPVYQGLIFPLFPNGKTIPFSGRRSTSSDSKTSRPDTRATGKAQVQQNALALAARLPNNYRAQMKDVYVQSFDVFTQVEQKLKLQREDVANGLAAFIVGNYMVANNVEVPDEDFARVVPQVRNGLLASKRFQTLSPDQRRQLYEQTAMVGTFMVIARMAFRKTPNPQAEASFRETARANLAAVLDRQADQLRVDSEGLHFR